MSFASLDDLRTACRDLPSGSTAAADAAEARQQVLTKPQGSLGRLETLAAWLARWQERDTPQLDRVRILVFAGSHGVTRRGVSAFPAEVTAQMVANFATGGAAINQIARIGGAELAVRPLDIEQMTGDFTEEPAMDQDAFLAAVNVGYDSIRDGDDLVCLGEMGIGNTTPAATTSAALGGGDGTAWPARRTAADDAGLARHAAALADPLAVAAHLGGRELAAILGATLAARHKRVCVLLDGFVSTAAAAPLARLHPQGLAHACAGHVSAEAGHRRLLSELGLAPLLDLGMRLGEASGAGVAISILRAALACHAGMATFADAGVSGKD